MPSRNNTYSASAFGRFMDRWFDTILSFGLPIYGFAIFGSAVKDAWDPKVTFDADSGTVLHDAMGRRVVSTTVTLVSPDFLDRLAAVLPTALIGIMVMLAGYLAMKVAIPSGNRFLPAYRKGSVLIPFTGCMICLFAFIGAVVFESARFSSAHAKVAFPSLLLYLGFAFFMLAGSLVGAWRMGSSAEAELDEVV